MAKQRIVPKKEKKTAHILGRITECLTLIASGIILTSYDVTCGKYNRSKM